MKITNKTHLLNDGKYFKLVEYNAKGREVNVKHFGTVYRALQHILDSEYDLNDDLYAQFTHLVKAIEMNKDKIKDNFRIEVKGC